MTAPRLPDFIVIGAAKSGTTTLHRWLATHDGAFLSVRKELDFFSNRWDRGIDWYASHFAAAPPGAKAGESSPSYTHAATGERTATRMRTVVPDVRLVYVVRHPVDRLLSHYRYRTRRAVLFGSLDDAVREPDNLLVTTSCYHARLLPYIERFPAEQLCVVRFEDLVDPSGAGWGEVLDHVGLPARPAPGGVHNATAEGRQTSRVIGRLSMARRRLHLPAPPRWTLPLSRRLVRATRRPYRDPLAGAVPTLPASVTDEIWDDVARLEAWLGRTEPLWPRPAD